MQVERKHDWGIQKDVRIANRNNWEITWVGETSRNSRVVLWFGRTCDKVNWEILLIVKEKDRATAQRLYSMCGRHSVQKKEKLETYGRIVRCLFSNRLEMQEIGPKWWTRHCLVCKQTCTSCHQMDKSLVTNAWLVWSLTFITRVITYNIGMWETRLSIVDWDCSKTQLLQETLKILNQPGPNNADWDCLKTLTSQETLKIQNPLLEEHCAFLEVEHSYLQVGCVRSKLQLHTVPLNPSLYL